MDATSQRDADGDVVLLHHAHPIGLLVGWMPPATGGNVYIVQKNVDPTYV